MIRNGKRLPATRTKQFIVGNIGLFKSGVVIPRTSPLEVLLTADLAAMKISNHQTIAQHTTGTTEWPVTALAHIVHDILSNGGNDDTLMFLVWNGAKWENVEVHNVINMVRDTIKYLKLHIQAIYNNLVGAH